MQTLLLLSGGAIAGIVIAAVVVLLIFAVIVWYIVCGNNLLRLVNTTEEAWSAIDVRLKKRYDLIPNLVNTVKGYAAHESQTLTAVIAARNAAMTATGDAKMAAENALTDTLKSLFALQEAYPALKADTSFLNLQQQLSTAEREIASTRDYYNGAVKALNIKVDIFPSNIVARRKGIGKKTYFELTSSVERDAPVVTF